MRLTRRDLLMVLLALSFVASKTAKNPVDPFIDPAGYLDFIDAAEAEFRSGRGIYSRRPAPRSRAASPARSGRVARSPCSLASWHESGL